LHVILHFAYLLNVLFQPQKWHKKADDNTITDYLTLLLSCRLLVLYYAIKTPLKTKSPYDFHRRLLSAISSRTDSLIPLKYLVVILVIPKKL